MKHSVTLLLFVFAVSTAHAQINVRVKSSGNTKEVDIKTNGKSGSGKEKETGNTNNYEEAKSSSPAGNTQKPATKPASDTTSKPASSGSFDETYKGPGKVEIKSFWKNVEVFNQGKGTSTTLGNMKRSLDNLKQKDPSYNTASMDEEYKRCKAEIDKVVEAGKTPEQKAVDAKVNGYSGPAKNQVVYFWEYAMQVNDKASEGEVNYAIGKMDYALKATKEYDPSYNVGEMEATLKKTKDDLKAKKLAEVRNTSGDRRKPPQEEDKTGNDPVKIMEKLFLGTNISVGSTSDAPEAPAKIEAYKAKLAQLLAMDYTDAIIKVGRNAKGRISGFTSSTDRELEKIDNLLKEIRDKTQMQYLYYTIQYHLVFWEAANKVFPEESNYGSMYNKVSAAFTKFGTLEQLYAKAEANQKEYIKNNKLPAAAVKDAKLEKVLTDGFNKLYGPSRNVNALKAVLTQNGWTTLRNSLTGVVVGRERSAKLAYKGSDGKCYLLDDYVFIREDYVGGSFINTVAVFNGLFSEEMLCENVK